MQGLDEFNTSLRLLEQDCQWEFHNWVRNINEA